MAFLTSLISTVVFIFVNALLLMLATKLFKLKDTSYKSALWVTAILGVVSFIVGLIIPPLGAISFVLIWVVIGILLAIYLIKTKYKLDWGKSALVWLVFFIFEIIAVLIVGFILGLIFVAILGTAMV